MSKVSSQSVQIVTIIVIVIVLMKYRTLTPHPHFSSPYRDQVRDSNKDTSMIFGHGKILLKDFGVLYTVHTAKHKKYPTGFSSFEGSLLGTSDFIAYLRAGCNPHDPKQPQYVRYSFHECPLSNVHTPYYQSVSNC